MTKYSNINNTLHNNQEGGRAGVPLYLPCTGCVFVGGTWASFVSLRPPTKNISRCFSSMPLHPLPQAARAYREVNVHSKMSKIASF